MASTIPLTTVYFVETNVNSTIYEREFFTSKELAEKVARFYKDNTFPGLEVFSGTCEKKVWTIDGQKCWQKEGPSFRLGLICTEFNLAERNLKVGKI